MEIKEYLTLVNRNVMTNKVNKYIVIHYVGAVSTAKNNAIYFHSTNRSASANYFVDDVDIYRVVKDSDKAWHCGADRYYCDARNNNSIGIEMCCYLNNGKLDMTDKVITKTIELTKELMKKYNIPISNVVRHYDVTHKICPEPFVNNPNRWADFKNRLVDVKTYEVNATSGLWLLDSSGKRIKAYSKGTKVTYITDGYDKYGYHYLKVNCCGTIGYMAQKYLK